MQELIWICTQKKTSRPCKFSTTTDIEVNNCDLYYSQRRKTAYCPFTVGVKLNKQLIQHQFVSKRSHGKAWTKAKSRASDKKRGIGKSCPPQTPPIFVRSIFRPRSTIWITNFSKKKKSVNIVRSEKNDQMHIKSWVIKLPFLCVGSGCYLCSLRYLKCTTASFQRFSCTAAGRPIKHPHTLIPPGTQGMRLCDWCPRVRFKGTPPT